MTTGDAPRERNRSATRLVQQGYERQSAPAFGPGIHRNVLIGIFTAPAVSISASRRPFEAELHSITLWPEVEKVFGHGYEVGFDLRCFLQRTPGIDQSARLLQSIAIGVSSSRKLFATACRATTMKHAAVRMYDTETFRPFGRPLEGHTLTVTRIAFSPDDQVVLTVSRDRTWRLFQKEESGRDFFSSCCLDRQKGLTDARRICTARRG